MKKLLSRRLIFVLSLLSAIFCFVVLYELSMLPIKYYAALVVIVLAIILLLYRGEKDKENKHPMKVAFLKLIHIVLSVFLVVASITAMKGSGFIDSFTGGGNQTIEYNVIALKSSSYDQIEDLKEAQFGANTSVDAINVNKVETMIEEKIGDIEVETYTSHSDVIDALLNENIDAMIVKSIDLETFDDIESGFNDKIKIIDQYEIIIPSAKANSAKVTKEPFLIFISGTDKTGPIDTFSLSDVNMIAAINPTTKQVLLISIPRDYYVDIIGMDGVSGKDKLTHSAKGGINCTLETVENLMGVDFNYYAKFNFTSFMNVVDSLGGVTINIPKYNVIGNSEGKFTTKIYGYQMKPGETQMDAKHALAFVRERKSFVEGDAIRGKNQMLMIKAIIKKCCSPAIIKNMDGVFESLSDSFETNLESSDIKSLINMQIDDMASWDIQSYRLTGDESKRAFHLATVGNVTKVNPRGLIVNEPYSDSVKQAKEYIQIIMESNEILKVKEDE